MTITPEQLILERTNAVCPLDNKCGLLFRELRNTLALDEILFLYNLNKQETISDAEFEQIDKLDSKLKGTTLTEMFKTKIKETS